MIRTATRKDGASARKAARKGPAPTARKAVAKVAATRSHGSAAAVAANGAAINGHAVNGAGTHARLPQAAESLDQCVWRSLEQYFASLDGAKPHPLHNLVLGAIERPLLQFALQRCEGNQSATADLLGINRNTLRRKLHDYGLS